MTYKEMTELIEGKIFPEIIKIRDAGQKEYARETDDVLANFKRISTWLDLPVEKVIMVYLLKHIDGITAWCNGHKSQRDNIRGRLTDILVYTCLFQAHVEETESHNKLNKES